MIDEGESIEKASLRELHEECGFVGDGKERWICIFVLTNPYSGVKIIDILPDAAVEPGMSSSKSVLVHVEVLLVISFHTSSPLS